MKISYHSHIGGLDLSQGYGTAGYGIVTSLKKFGYDVPFNDPNADILLNFTQPPYYQFHNTGQYNIGYTPWESNEVDPSWILPMNAVDEMWTTSPLIAKWFNEAGCTQNIKVFEHGIDHRWTPKHRRSHRKVRFLHVGSDAVRKGGQDAFDAFIDAFGRNNPNVSLTFKTHASYCMIRKELGTGLLYTATEYSDNIKHIHGEFTLDELIGLFHSHDALVYPSYGEGFGFIPLQALASGMPTIQTSTWAPYSRFVIPELNVSDTMTSSPWPLEHPGAVLQPSHDDLVKAYLYAYDHFQEVADKTFEQAPQIHKEYDWDYLVRKQFAPVVAKVNSL
jgi:glycosyltransferase involved in cell wall biosynthesis